MTRVLKHKGLLVILLIGLTLRLAVLFTKGPWLSLMSDDRGYMNSALAFLSGHGITYTYIDEPTVHILPGITLLLAPFFVFGQTGVSMTLIKLMMILFGLLSIILTYAIGQFLFNRYAGWIGAFLLAIYIPQILTDNLVLTEAPFTALFLGFIYFSIRLAHDPRMSWFYWVISLYLTMLYFRPTLALLPIPLLIYFILKKYPLKLALKQFGIAAILLILVMSPWWIRNYVHYHEFIPLSGGAGNPMLLGTYQGHGYKYGPSYNEVMDGIEKSMKDSWHYDRQQAQKDVALERMKRMYADNPKQFLYTYTISKTVAQWSQPFYWIKILGVPLDTMKQLYNKSIGMLFLLSVIAFFVFPKRRTEWIFVGLIIGYLTVLNDIFFAYPRYNQPLLPLLFIFAAAGGIGLLQRIKKKLPI
ncbi:hypothetical protein DVB69_05235 [Sporosarcina sp. BI001-red]|uniref:ArnT family glycosyltransferase n=1 Tax=Sporosarcina sp. BI001-red TaxID=2282866 RepID=UPI000E26117F|nr:glycosyltransferase family 39 protein [Sporosarcina sp. BI001-red]REB08543.1 hypothetical protein DVB69_05235 [Sporosarcina sp. BI001-red]